MGRDIELPDNVRAYLVAGTQHGGGAGVHVAEPPAGICRYPGNPMAAGQVRVALTMALYDWVAHGVEPPASRFPTVANGGLVPPGELDFPRIPGVDYGGSVNGLREHDHSVVPPTEGPAYTVLVGRVDADGNMTQGVRHPNLVAPIGTYTGWNLRREGFADGEQCAGAGSFLAFPADARSREAAGDPRASLAERYPDHAAYVDAVSRATVGLVRERLLLTRGARQIMELARASTVGGGPR
jgi:hypothetical protein